MSIFDPMTLVGVHSLLSVVALLAGIVVVAGLLTTGGAGRGTVWFLVTAAATSATGYLLPAKGVLPSHIVGAVALIVLAVVIAACYAGRLAGAWRRIDAVGMVASLYFLVFVALAQAFAKVLALMALAPTQSEPPFAIAQGAVLVLFGAIGWAASRATTGAAVAARA